MDSATSTSPAKLKIERITAGYDGSIVVKDISFDVPRGSIAAVIGLSGVGKSTLFNVIAGLLKPYSGRVLLNGNDITDKPGAVGYMLQKDLLLPFKTVIDNIALPLIIKGMKKKDAYALVRPKLERFGLADKEKRYPNELSGGMRQRAALLRTHLFSEEAALLDEPFSALDSITRSAMHNWYMDIAATLKPTTVLITHDIDEAALLSDTVYVLKGKPAALTARIDIDLPKPRSSVDSEFVHIKKRLLVELQP